MYLITDLAPSLCSCFTRNKKIHLFLPSRTLAVCISYSTFAFCSEPSVLTSCTHIRHRCCHFSTLQRNAAFRNRNFKLRFGFKRFISKIPTLASTWTAAILFQTCLERDPVQSGTTCSLSVALHKTEQWNLRARSNLWILQWLSPF
jgi:hypothetical protein